MVPSDYNLSPCCYSDYCLHKSGISSDKKFKCKSMHSSVRRMMNYDGKHPVPNGDCYILVSTDGRYCVKFLSRGKPVYSSDIDDSVIFVTITEAYKKISLSPYLSYFSVHKVEIYNYVIVHDYGKV